MWFFVMDSFKSCRVVKRRVGSGLRVFEWDLRSMARYIETLLWSVHIYIYKPYEAIAAEPLRTKAFEVSLTRHGKPKEVLSCFFRWSA